MATSTLALGLSKHLLLIAFILAIYVALTQFSPDPFLSTLTFNLAYVVFPFLILAVLLAVYEYSWAMVKNAWRNGNWKRFSWSVGVEYALFYVFATNTVSVPDRGVSIPSVLSHGFLIPFEVYGPMTVWPDIEFYSPSLNLTGYFSVGNVMLLIALTFLTACSVTLSVQSVSMRRRARLASGSGAASLLAAFSTNACCCCTPVLYSVLATLFGGTLPNAIGESLVNPESPVSNLLVLATLGSLLTSTILSTRNCRMTPKK